MKKLLLICCMCLVGIGSFAQKMKQGDVPSAVLNAFKQHFPNVTDVDWKQKGDVYEVEFEVGKADHEAWFDNTGKMIRHEQDIKVSELPAPVIEALKKGYSDYKIAEAEKIDWVTATTYEVELKTLTKELKLVFDGAGKQLDQKADD